MPLNLTIRTDHGPTIERSVSDLAYVLSLALHQKPRSLVEAMRAKRDLAMLYDDEFERACLWVQHGDSWSIKADGLVLDFITNRACEALGLSNEQVMELTGRALVEAAPSALDRAA